MMPSQAPAGLKQRSQDLKEFSLDLKRFVESHLHLRMSLGEIICRSSDVYTLGHWAVCKEQLYETANRVSKCVGWRPDRLKSELDSLFDKDAAPGAPTASSISPTATQASVSDFSLDEPAGDSATAARQALFCVKQAYDDEKFDKAHFDSIIKYLQISHSHALDSVHAAVKALEVLDDIASEVAEVKVPPVKSAKKSLRDNLLWRTAGLVLGLDSRTAMDAVIMTGDVSASTREQLPNTLVNIRNQTAVRLKFPAHGMGVRKRKGAASGSSDLPGSADLPGLADLPDLAGAGGVDDADDIDSEMEQPGFVSTFRIRSTSTLHKMYGKSARCPASKAMTQVWDYTARVLEAIERVPVPGGMSRLDAVLQPHAFAKAAKLAVKDALLVKCLNHGLGINDSETLNNTFWNARRDPQAWELLMESFAPVREFTGGCHKAANYQ